MERGMFLTIEGGEGSGKTSLISRLASWLGSLGYDVIVSREPGGTRLGEKVREIFLDVDTNSMMPITETLLMLAARYEHVARVIEPALAKGSIVICDRYIDSTLAYQAFGRGEEFKKVWQLAVQAVPLLPDITFYLDVPVDVGLSRITRRNQHKKDRIEAEALGFHERVRDGFVHLAKKFSSRIVFVDASVDEESVTKIAKDAIVKVLRPVCT